MDQVIKGKIYYNGSLEDACLGIKNGKIVAIKKILEGDEVFDYGKKLILPAGVDIHVHFREPGMTQKEDWHTGSLAAAFGGVGCVFDMPNNVPQTTNIKNVEEKKKTAKSKSVVDFGVYAGVTNDNLDKIESLGKKCNGFKVFLGSSTLSLLLDKKKLREAFDLISITGKPILVHAEDEECLIQHRGSESTLSDHMRFRPAVCEGISIKEVFEASRSVTNIIHICHVSSCEGLDFLKKRPHNITCGVTPHHSLLSVDRDLITPSFYKVNPPIRTGFDKESLFNALKNGLVDVLESDHAPHTREDKNTSFEEAPSGVPGVETLYPMFLYMVKKEVIPLQRLVNLFCNRPADILGVPKGKMMPGYDADFIVVDLKEERKIKSENLHSKADWTPFEDFPAVFPETVFIRGEKVIDENEIQVKSGFGRFVGA